MTSNTLNQLPIDVINERIREELNGYDRVIVFFSGGKDSIACVLHLLEMGMDPSKLELHHHDVDGEHDPEARGLMDWPCTHGYVRAFGDALGLKVFFSWREGGLEREMLRNETPTAPVHFMRGDGTMGQAGGVVGRAPAGTRRKFPQVTADLSRRYCSGVAKIDVAGRMLCNDDRFRNSRTLVLTGERAEESAGRAKYAQFEPHRSDARHGRLGRHIDQWRAVHQWAESEIWAIIERHSINPHPSYRVGYSRASCLHCIFASNNQWATNREMDPFGFQRIADYEQEFGFTIQRDRSVVEMADKGTPLRSEPGWREIAMSREYDAPIFSEDWTLPIGAYGEACGPT